MPAQYQLETRPKVLWPRVLGLFCQLYSEDLRDANLTTCERAQKRCHDRSNLLGNMLQGVMRCTVHPAWAPEYFRAEHLRSGRDTVVQMPRLAPQAWRSAARRATLRQNRAQAPVPTRSRVRPIGDRGRPMGQKLDRAPLRQASVRTGGSLGPRRTFRHDSL